MSMSENGSCRSRPYPPSAASAVPGGGSAPSKSVSTQASRSAVRLRADHSPWEPGEYARSKAVSSSRSVAIGSVTGGLRTS